MRVQLENLFNPKAIALIGASNRPESVGFLLMQNVVQGGYTGQLYPVNLKYEEVQGYRCYEKVEEIEKPIELAVICTPPRTILALLEECEAVGIESVLLLSRQVPRDQYPAIKAKAKSLKIRIVGPNSLGVLSPSLGVNTSLEWKMALPGNIAFISQSGGLGTSILDWSIAQQVGFSHFISLGAMLDVDFDDLIDYLGTDYRTSCILLYLECVNDARRFMSAARAFAKRKPIIVLKAGKGGNATTARSHTGALVGDDAVADAAFQRAGIIRVDTLAQLFHCAQALAHQPRPKGNRLAIVTNAIGPGLLAADHLKMKGGKLATFSPQTITQLEEAAIDTIAGNNPIVITKDQEVTPYEIAVKACLLDPEVDGVLAILTPETRTPTDAIATAMTALSKKYKKTLLTSWMGEQSVQESREILESGRVPYYRYPESAVVVFLKMYEHHRILELLYETPSANPLASTPDRAQALSILEVALAENRNQLSEVEARQLMQAYQILPTVYQLVHEVEEAVVVAAKIGYPVVLKIASPDIIHKTEVKGVRLNIIGEQALRATFADMLQQVALLRPKARVQGVIIEKMVNKDFELLIGAKRDEQFGPVVVFGKGGIGVEVYRDIQMGLPPLNMALAHHIVSRTQLFPLLQGYKGQAGVELDYLAALLCNFSSLLIDFPVIQEIDINPFVVDEEGGLALDAHIVLDPDAHQPTKPYDHLAITPYPAHFTKVIQLRNGQEALLRPIRPEDEPMEMRMLEDVSKQSLYYRFFGYIPNIDHEFLSRFTHIDYDREMAIIAEIEVEGEQRMIGVVRVIADAWQEGAEYAIVIADPWQGQGLGGQMTDFILEVAKAMGLKFIYASVLSTNEGMIRLFKSRGFSLEREEFDTYNVHLDLLK
ncbi:MAG: bifunctional acetate--CoA ligase family protein/GNAT family N-acetyltransferase [Bacteroidota bacterium]